MNGGGERLPDLVLTPSVRQLVQYAGASGDFYEMHYDVEFASELGYPDLAVHGLLKAALLGRLLRGWVGDRGRIEVLDVSYRGMDFRDRPLRCAGEVSDVDGDLVAVEVWTEDTEGRRTTFGSAKVRLHA